MGIRQVTIYTCDGCGASVTLPREEGVRGFTSIKVPVRRGDRGDKLLCTVCYSAVEWVVKFQGITIPPKTYKGEDGRYRLRKDKAITDPEPGEDDFLDDDEGEEEI